MAGDTLPLHLCGDPPSAHLLRGSAAIPAWARAPFQEPHGPRSKPYELDFQPTELILPLTEQQQLPTGHGRAALRLRRGAWRRSEAMAQLARALERSEALAPKALRPVVLFTMVYGERYTRYLPGWLARAAAFGLENRWASRRFQLAKHRTIVYCLDDHMAEAPAWGHAL